MNLRLAEWIYPISKLRSCISRCASSAEWQKSANVWQAGAGGVGLTRPLGPTPTGSARSTTFGSFFPFVDPPMGPDRLLRYQIYPSTSDIDQGNSHRPLHNIKLRLYGKSPSSRVSETRPKRNDREEEEEKKETKFDAMAAVKVLLLDIEGTVCPISFVKDVLFPYALQALPNTLATQWDDPSFVPYRDSFPVAHGSSPEALEAHMRDLMAQDVKIAYLKSLQGYLWKEGYRRGELKAPLFPDVAPAIRSWTDRGLKVMIYSSGSVPAQKLLFTYTNAEPADMTSHITDWFDTVNAGLKTEVCSYEAILAAHPEAGAEPGEWLFLSDNTKEADTAKDAGMQSFVLSRPGNPELSLNEKSRHRVISSFNEVEV
ncbi:acireductone synthase-like protein [Zalerion maritima]|uniref:Enolase-phosphatase E1 n=1 Tax=Zalerion maritima TaxID=339359 RepID=A0AAD5S454_9PEZI|nr:acireductone synthase-like protein [Zalerion maritima]